METNLDSRSLRIQTILFHQSEQDINRLVVGLGNAVRRAKAESGLGPVAVHLGDCSNSPVVTEACRSALEISAQKAGIDSLDYQFFHANLGHAGGQNRLLETLDEDLILFLNPDAYPNPNLLLELALPLGDPRSGIIEARQIPLEHPKTFDPLTGETSWACMAGALVTRAVIEATGGLDADSFFLYCDDVDFSWRARLAAFSVVHQPTALIFHDKRLDVEGRMMVGDAEVFYAVEAALLLAWKYSREDLAEQWAAGLATSQNSLQRDAVESFRRRQKMGTLPEQLDPQGRVAQFRGANFADHRFSYDD